MVTIGQDYLGDYHYTCYTWNPEDCSGRIQEQHTTSTWQDWMYLHMLSSSDISSGGFVGVLTGSGSSNLPVSCRGHAIIGARDAYLEPLAFHLPIFVPIF